MHKNKKGSLSLSMNAIVIVVLAFVMMGLGLTMTNMIFERAESGITGLPDFKVGQDASAGNPLAIPEEVTVRRNAEIIIEADFYNTASTQADNVLFKFSSCIEAGVNDPTDAQTAADIATKIPTISSLPIDVPASDSLKTKMSIQENQLLAGTYICNFEAHETADGATTIPATSTALETKTITLNVDS